MADNKIRGFPPSQRNWRTVSHSPSAGFTLVEMLIVVAISMVLAATSFPLIRTTMTNMHLGSAASSLSAAIQSTRYQAISVGCPFTMAISTGFYQLQTEALSGTPPTCSATFSNPPSPLDRPVPYASSDIPLNAGQTLQFNPSGTITGATSAPFTFVLSLANGTATKTITVSGVGNVKVR